MKITAAVVAQLAATAAAGAAAVFDLVPSPKAKTYLLASYLVMQFALFIYALFTTPPGKLSLPFTGPEGETARKMLEAITAATKKAAPVLLLAAGLAGLARAQEPPQLAPADFVAAGIAYNAQGTPQIAGTALYAHRMTEAGTYSFSLVDALPNSYRPLRVTTAYTTGIGQRVRTLAGRIPVFAVGSIGVATAGENTGWSWTAGGAAAIPLRGNWALLPNLRVMKSSVSRYQAAIGLMIGWGK